MERQGRYIGTLSRLKAEERQDSAVRRSSLARLSDTHMRTVEISAVSKTNETYSSEQSPMPVRTMRKPKRNIFQAGELFKDSPLSEYYWANEDEPFSSVMLLNGKAPRLVPTLKASFDPVSRPSDSNLPRLSLLSDSLSSSEGATEPSPLVPYAKAFLTPGAYKSKQVNSGSGRQGVRKLRVREGKVTRNVLPAIRELRPSNRDSGPLLTREDFPLPLRPAHHRRRIRSPSSISKRPIPMASTEQREQEELEASIQELDQLLSRLRKPALRSISVARDLPGNQTRHSPSRRYA